MVVHFYFECLKTSFLCDDVRCFSLLVAYYNDIKLLYLILAQYEALMVIQDKQHYKERITHLINVKNSIV